jgi:hypothetical protein
MSSSLTLKRFNPLEAFREKCFNMVIIGHKHTGKSTLVRDIAYRVHQLGFPRCVVFSGTEAGNSFYTSFIPSAYVHTGLDMSKLTSIVDAQRQVVANVRDAEKKAGGSVGVDTRLVIILDDIMYKRNATKSELFGELFMNGRHWQITLILTCQYVMLLDIACRSNIDYLMCLREAIPKNRIKLYENFFGCFPRRQDFFTVLDRCTQNYEGLVLDNTHPVLEIEKCVLWYKAEVSLPAFMFGQGSEEPKHQDRMGATAGGGRSSRSTSDKSKRSRRDETGGRKTLSASDGEEKAPAKRDHQVVLAGFQGFAGRQSRRNPQSP